MKLRQLAGLSVIAGVACGWQGPPPKPHRALSWVETRGNSSKGKLGTVLECAPTAGFTPT